MTVNLQNMIWPVWNVSEEMGYFDWVDQFLAQNPGYVELSDRMILDARQSLRKVWEESKSLLGRFGKHVLLVLESKFWTILPFIFLTLRWLRSMKNHASL